MVAVCIVSAAMNELLRLLNRPGTERDEVWHAALRLWQELLSSTDLAIRRHHHSSADIEAAQLCIEGLSEELRKLLGSRGSGMASLHECVS
jgi:hypothetical protein